MSDNDEQVLPDHTTLRASGPADLNLIQASLEAATEHDTDITDAIYKRFFAACPAAWPLMQHSDEYMRGRMMAQVFELLLDPDVLGAGGYLHWEVDNHVDAYSVTPAMYPPFFAAVKDTVSETAAGTWQDHHEAAWGRRINVLVGDIMGYTSGKRG